MKTVKYPYRLRSLLFGLLLAACGGNMFENAAGIDEIAASDKKGSAIEAIQKGDFLAAEASLLEAIAANPDDVEARAMLGNVRMKQSGIDAVSISKIVDSSTDASGHISVTATIGALPAATATNLASLEKAVEAFNDIPADAMNSTQQLQKAMAEFSYAMLLTKKVATDEDGSFDSTKAADMSETEATRIVEMMKVSATTIGSIGGETNQKGSDKIIATTETIETQEGETIADKLRAYLEAQAAAVAATDK